MQSTIALYHKAMAINPNAGAWCETMGLSRNTLAVAKLRGRLSPGLAGALASNLPNEDVQHWINIATVECEQNPTIKERLMRVLKLYFPTAQRARQRAKTHARTRRCRT